MLKSIFKNFFLANSKNRFQHSVVYLAKLALWMVMLVLQNSMSQTAFVLIARVRPDREILNFGLI